MLKVELPLRDGLGGYDMPGEVLLNRFSGTNLYYVGLLANSRTTACFGSGSAYSRSYEGGEHRRNP